jgi:aspartyl-tRNA(Asn)/glutamyl-tRNA(Gln) amidotransferase subunit B
LEKGEAKAMNYLPVIGLEVHVELNTKSKMFCGCSAQYFGAQPNTNTCPVCLGLPGALPYINEEAIKKCIQIGLALNCTLNEVSRFERKNYLYPDLPKGYQVSQYRWPLCIKGELEVAGKKIRINRVHQEEDTGKLMHQGADTTIDFNRSSVPLVEIVTEPDFENSEQVREFAKVLQQLFKYLKASDADMEKGQMRLEANVSVRPEGQTELPNYRVELKNINSFKFMADAIEYEIKRQSEALEKGETLVQETRGWNEEKKETFSQRSKEEAHDYRYFPEPDLPELRVKSEELRVREEMPELPWEALKRLVGLGITERDAAILTATGELTSYFEAAIEEGVTHQLSPKEIANVVINQKIDTAKVTPQALVEDIVNKKQSVVSDEGVIEQHVAEVISENPSLVEQYKAGKVAVLQALIGMVMRKSGGKADINVVKKLLEVKLA